MSGIVRAEGKVEYIKKEFVFGWSSLLTQFKMKFANCSYLLARLTSLI